MGSAAIDLAYVAWGKFEGFFELNLSPWDVAAGILLVEEAGGKIAAFNAANDPLFGREIIAANLRIFNKVQTILNNSGL